jgi:3-phenylpropionate/trans-cinnamate dioxygenase ferredoxin subunit
MEKVCLTSDVAVGTMKGVIANNKQILLANVDGKFYAVDAICSHRSGYLPKGKLEKNVVICPAHGVQFDVTTGKIYKDLPGLMKMMTGKPQDLNSYSVEIKDGAVFVDA